VEKLFISGFVLIVLGSMSLLRDPSGGLAWYDTGAVVVGLIMLAIGGFAAYKNRDR
jgi:hypothetical protein